MRSPGRNRIRRSDAIDGAPPGERRRYENFEVRIEKAGEGYRARVWADSVGEATAEIDMAGPMAQLDGFLFNVGQVRKRSRGPATARIIEAQKFGAAMFDAVFRGDALGCLQSSLANAAAHGTGTRIRLRLTDCPELADMPWEFLYSRPRKEFLSLSASTPVIRYLECPESIRPLYVAPPLRILAVISSPSDYPRLDVEREWQTLQETLRDLLEKNLVELVRLEKPQLALLPRALKRDFHILHFIGHGEFNDSGGALVFEDEWQRGKAVSAEKLATVLCDHQSLRLVVLNSCEGARSSRSDPFSGTAQTLVWQGIPAVLAMQFEITDEAAITVAAEFYSSVAVGDPIDTALADARLKLYALQDDGIEWATPVLYLRAPDGRIFDVVQTPAVKDQRTPIPDPPPPPPPRRFALGRRAAVGGAAGGVFLVVLAVGAYLWPANPKLPQVYHPDAAVLRPALPVATPGAPQAETPTRAYPKPPAPKSDAAVPAVPPSNVLFHPLQDIAGKWRHADGSACSDSNYGLVTASGGLLTFQWHYNDGSTHVTVERITSPTDGPIVETVVEKTINTPIQRVGDKLMYAVSHDSWDGTDMTSGKITRHRRC